MYYPMKASLVAEPGLKSWNYLPNKTHTPDAPRHRTKIKPTPMISQRRLLFSGSIVGDELAGIVV
jgi:hypothetical protein